MGPGGYSPGEIWLWEEVGICEAGSEVPRPALRVTELE